MILPIADIALLLNIRGTKLDLVITTALDTEDAKKDAASLIESFRGNAIEWAKIAQGTANHIRLEQQETYKKQMQIEKMAQDAILSNTEMLKSEHSKIARIKTTATGLSVSSEDLGKLNEYENIIKALSQSILFLDQVQEEAGNNVVAFSSKFRSGLNAISEQFSGFSELATEIKNVMAATFAEGGTSAEQTARGYANLKPVLNELKGEYNDYLKVVNVHIKQQTQETIALEAVQSSLKGHVLGINKAASSQEKFTELTGRLDGIAKHLSGELPDIGSKFQSLGDKVDDSSGAFKAISDATEDLKSNISKLDISTLDSRLAGLESTLDETGTAFHPLRDGIKDIRKLIVDRKPFIDISKSIQNIVTDESITDIKQYQSRLSSVAATAKSNTEPAIQAVGGAIDNLVKKSGKWGIGTLNKSMRKLSETFEGKLGIEAIVNEISNMNNVVEDVAVNADKTTAALDKLTISKKAIQSVEDYGDEMEKVFIAQAADVRSNVDKVAKSIKTTGKRMEDANGHAKKMSSSINDISESGGRFSKMFGKWSVIGSKVLIFAGVFGTIKNNLRELGETVVAVTRGMFNLAEQAAKVKDAEVGFHRLASRVTDSATAMRKIVQAGGEVIERHELIAAATKAALAGIPVDQFDKLVTGARALAAVTGRDASEAVDRLTEAIAKQERRLLDELGIVIRAEDAYDRYARKHNIAASALTEHQKVAAFFEHTMSRVNEKVNILGGTIDESQQPFLRLRAATRDLKLEVGEYIRQSPAFNDALKVATGLVLSMTNQFASSEVKFSNMMARISNLTDKYDDIVEVYKGLIPEAEKLSASLKIQGITLLETQEANEKLEAILATIKSHFPELADMFGKDFAGALKKAGEQAEALAKSMLPMIFLEVNEALKEGSESFAENIKKQKDSVNGLALLGQAYVNLSDQIVETGKRAIDADSPLDLLLTEYNLVNAKKYQSVGLHVSLTLDKIASAQSVFNQMNLDSANSINKTTSSLAKLISFAKVGNKTLYEQIKAVTKLSDSAIETSDAFKYLMATGRYSKKNWLLVMPVLRNIIASMDELDNKGGKKPKIPPADALSEALTKETARLKQSSKNISEAFIPTTDLGLAKQQAGLLKQGYEQSFNVLLEARDNEQGLERQHLDRLVKMRQQYSKFLSDAAVAEYDGDAALAFLHKEKADAIDTYLTKTADYYRMNISSLDDLVKKQGNLTKAEKKVAEEEAKIAEARRKAKEKAAKEAMAKFKSDMKEFNDTLKERNKKEADEAKALIKTNKDRDKKIYDNNVKQYKRYIKFADDMSKIELDITEATTQKQLRSIKERAEKSLKVLGVELKFASDQWFDYYKNLEAITNKSAVIKTKAESDMLDKINQASTIKSLIGIKKDIGNLEIAEDAKTTLLKAVDDRRLELSKQFNESIRSNLNKTTLVEVEGQIAKVEASTLATNVKIRNMQSEAKAAGASAEELAVFDDLITENTKARETAVSNIRKAANTKALKETEKNRDAMLKFDIRMAKERLRDAMETSDTWLEYRKEVLRLEKQAMLYNMQSSVDDAIIAAEKLYGITQEYWAKRDTIIKWGLSSAKRIESDYVKHVKSAETELFDKRFTAYKKLADMIISNFKAIGKIVNDTSDKLQMFFDMLINISEAIDKIKDAALDMEDLEKRASAINVIALGYLKIMQKITSMGAAQRKAEKKRYEEYLKEIQQISASMAQSISDTMTSGLHVDFGTLVKSFIKAQLAEKIGKIFTDQMGPGLNRLKIAITGKAGAAAISDEDAKEMTSRLADVVTTAGLSGLEILLKRADDVKTLALFDELSEDRVLSNTDLDALARSHLAYKSSLLSVGKEMDSLKNTWQAVNPKMQSVVDSVTDIVGSLDDNMGKLSENLPTSTFRAITEPTGNMILLLMGRQVDLLSLISSNTEKLHSIESLLQSGLSVNTSPAASITNQPSTTLPINTEQIFQEQDTAVRNRRTAIGRTRIKRMGLR